MALDDTNSFEDINITSSFDGAVGELFSPEDLAEITGVAPAQVNPYDHFETIYIQQCVGNIDTPDQPERMFGYGVVIGFQSLEDAEGFRNHPDNGEIENTIKQFMRSDGKETLILEGERDQNKDIYPDADTEGFNDNTLGDFQISVDEIIPEINQTYGVNIEGGFVLEESVSIPALPGLCDAPQPLPDNVASIATLDTMKLGG